jgi:hypothetical protein
MSEEYVDPWREYKTILARTRKKFLKKPNLTQAAVDLTALAQRLQYISLALTLTLQRRGLSGLRGRVSSIRRARAQLQRQRALDDP